MFYVTGTLPTTATYTTAVRPTHAPLKQKETLSITLSIAFIIIALLIFSFITAIIIFRKKFCRSNNPSVTLQQITPRGENGNVAESEDDNSLELQQITPVGDNVNTENHISTQVLMGNNGNTAESNDHNSTQELNHADAEEDENDSLLNDEKTKNQSPKKSFARQISNQISRQLSTKSGYSELSNTSSPPSFRHSTSRQSSNLSSNGN